MRLGVRPARAERRQPEPGGWLQGAARALLRRGDAEALSIDLAACNAYTAGLSTRLPYVARRWS